MEEETLYSDGTNWITNQRLIFGDAQYPLGDAINVQMKADYPQKVMLGRVAIIVGLVLLFGSIVYLQEKIDDPFFGPIIAVANIVAITAALIGSVWMLLADYLKQPSPRRAIRNIALFMVMVALVLIVFFVPISSSPATSLWIIILLGGWNLFRALGRRGTFHLFLVERIRKVEVFSSTDRQLVDNLKGYIQLALVRHSKLTSVGAKSSS